MFKMGGKLPIFRDHGPPVLQNLHLVASLIHHRLYGQDHARLELDPSPPYAVIGYLRIFMEAPADTMSDEIPDNRKAGRFDPLLNGGGDIAQTVSRHSPAGSRRKGPLRSPS